MNRTEDIGASTSGILNYSKGKPGEPQSKKIGSDVPRTVKETSDANKIQPLSEEPPFKETPFPEMTHHTH